MIASLLSDWFSSRHRSRASMADERFEDARSDFVDALEGVLPLQALPLLDRIADAASMQELWHLRVEIFERVAQTFDQHEADARLLVLNRHFPTRSPRSGFGGL